ncbi:transposase [Rhizobium laguerreae]|nr:transposase [Rhizobium laguerreae]
MSRLGKPTDNSYIESFNDNFRAKCPNAHWFISLDDARSMMEGSRRIMSSGHIARSAKDADFAYERLIGTPAELSHNPKTSSYRWPKIGEGSNSGSSHHIQK